MGKRLVLVTALLAALSPFAGCAGSSLMNSYLLPDANVGGDPGKTIKPIKGVLVWPLENIAAGTKSKGVETRLSGIFADTLTLRGGFERVVVLEEDQAKDLMARAGEELGLKKKPKTPGDGGLIATKLGQLTGTEAIITGRLEDYDEDKVDKATITIVSASFNLLDGREKAYATLDSFAAVKRVWRTSVKHTSKEGPLNSRQSIDDAARAMLREVVDRLGQDLGQGANVSGKAQAKKIAELNDAADKQLEAGEYDKAISSSNEVLKIQPDNKSAKRRIEDAEKSKLAAQEKAKAAALQKQVDEIKGKAEAAAKTGNLEGAIAEWKKILDLNKSDKEAAKSIEALEKQVSDRKKKEAEEKAAAEKAAAEKKAKEDAARKTREDADRKAKEEAEKKKAAESVKPVEPSKAVEPPKPVEPPKAVEAPKPVEPPKAVEAPKPVEPPKAVEAPKPAAAAPAAGGDLEALRNEAMAAFNKEDYPASRDLWKQILTKSPDDRQAKEMLETTEMLLNALK